MNLILDEETDARFVELIQGFRDIADRLEANVEKLEAELSRSRHEAPGKESGDPDRAHALISSA